jgi:hypothetical protein
MMIKNYNDFCTELVKSGFSFAGGGNDEGVFGLIPYAWGKEPPDSPIRWFTENPETDPSSWDMRILETRSDIAYAKLFFRKSGYLTKEWYPYFLAVRRGNKTFEEDYSNGAISHYAKRIYDVVIEYGKLPFHDIKQLAGFSKEDKSKFDNSLTELQMRMYLTVCGSQQKISQKGEAYGWASNVFCTTEDFFDEDVFSEAANIEAEGAVRKITEQVYKLNSSAVLNKIEKFIRG